ncbi:hypothetical protein ACJ41O_012643 [Fusarium nematophilum]
MRQNESIYKWLNAIDQSANHDDSSPVTRHSRSRKRVYPMSPEPDTDDPCSSIKMSGHQWYYVATSPELTDEERDISLRTEIAKKLEEDRQWYPALVVHDGVIGQWMNVAWGWLPVLPGQDCSG